MTMISHLGQDSVCEACGATGPVGPCCRDRHIRICDRCYRDRETGDVIKESGRCPWLGDRPDLTSLLRDHLVGLVRDPDELEEALGDLSASVETFFEPELARLRLEAATARTELNRAEQVVRTAVALVSESQHDTRAAVGELASLLVATYPELLGA